MATIKNNALLIGLSGKFGDVIFRQRNGKTILCNRPRKSSFKPTPSQQKTHNRFKEAAAYATRIMQDPDRRAEYESKLAKVTGNLYTAIVTDYLRNVERLTENTTRSQSSPSSLPANGGELISRPTRQAGGKGTRRVKCKQ